MERVLEIKSGEGSVTIPIRISLRAGRIYRTEFGRDLIADLAELYQVITGDWQTDIFKELSRNKVDLKDNSAVEAFFEARPELMLLMNDRVLSFDETETGLRILWTFAKNHDDTIKKDVEAWADSFETVLPVRELIEVVYRLWTTASTPTVALKNG